jgi:hypothetical protein
MDIEELEVLYKEHFSPLVETAIEQFQFSRPDAEDLVNKVFMVAVYSRPRIVEINSWLIGALTYAARRTRSDA